VGDDSAWLFSTAGPRTLILEFEDDVRGWVWAAQTNGVWAEISASEGYNATFDPGVSRARGLRVAVAVAQATRALRAAEEAEERNRRLRDAQLRSHPDFGSW
jgi:hypothetical protein